MHGSSNPLDMLSDAPKTSTNVQVRSLGEVHRKVCLTLMLFMGKVPFIGK
jgi:hypothetical protein